MKHFPSCIVASLLVLVLVDLAPAQEPTFSRRNPVVEAVKKTKSGIVTIRVPRPNGAKDMIGTGVIIDERGFIVTNRHVVGTSKNVIVRLADEGELTGEVVMAEARYDLAVLRIRTAKKLAVLPLAPVDDLMVGETVIAVGHPFGYTNTVSTGIISALGREITMPTGDVLAGLIQTDASINPGNSGGPLLNINGEFIGVNVALREGAQGIAFAINAGTVKNVLSQFLSAQRIAGVEHGLNCKEKITGETGDRQRVIVAADGILKGGDEILTVGSRNVVNAFDVERAFWDKKPGESVQLKVVRQGQPLTVTLTLASSAASQVATLPQAPSRQGMPLTTTLPAGNR